MTKDDIIRMALEAGVPAARLLHEFGTEGALCDSEIRDLRAAERLAQAAYAAGAAAEREEIAKMFDNAPKLVPSALLGPNEGCIVCGFNSETAASFIRSRGNT